MKRAALVVVLLVLGAAGVWVAVKEFRGGGHLGPKPARPIVVERVVPHAAVAVALTHSLEKTGAKLKLVEALKVVGFAAQLQGFATGKEFADGLISQLGVDIRSADSMSAAGIDGSRGAAVMLLFSEHTVFALPVSDEQKFRATMTKLAAARLGARVVMDKKAGNVTVTGFLVKDGEKPKLAYVLTQTYALVVDESGLGDIAALASLPESDSLQEDRDYLAPLGEAKTRENDLIIWFPSGSPALMLGPVVNLFATATLAPTGLELDAVGKWKDDGAHFAAFVPQKGDDNLGYLPRDAFLIGRFNGDASKLGPWTRGVLGKQMARALSDSGFDLQTQVYDQLKPGAAFSLSLSEAPPLGAGMPDLDIRRTNPFAYAQLAGVARVKSPEAVVPAFEKLLPIAPKFGATMELRTREDGQKALITTWSQGEGVHFSPKGELVFFGSPIGRLQELVKSEGTAGAPIEGLPDDAFSFVLDVSKLSSSLRALPDSTWGVGGFAMKTAATRWLEAADDLKQVSYSMGVRDNRAHFHVSLKLGTAKTP